MRIVNVLGYEGLYAVTDEGEIYSLKKGGIMKKSIGRGGYYEVKLSKNGISKKWFVHRVVLGSFKKKLNEKLVVDHINCNKLDNRLENLRQITSRENTARAKVSPYGRGVKLFKESGKYGSFININKIRYNLGMFLSAEEASNAYNKALSDWEEKGILPFKPDRTVKLCKRCGRILPKSEFYYVETHGSSWLCKECSRKAMKEQRIKSKNNLKKRVL